jgi:hypothetical protein
MKKNIIMIRLQQRWGLWEHHGNTDSAQFKSCYYVMLTRIHWQLLIAGILP